MQTLTSAVDRFMAKVRFEGDCWMWTAQITDHGYGRFRLDGRKRLAHCAAYELFVGPIPAGLEIDHTCRKRSCVNPKHLEAVTHLVNMQRAAPHRKVATHCKHGHPLDQKNTYITKAGRRSCRACHRRWDKIHYYAKRQRA